MSVFRVLLPLLAALPLAAFAEPYPLDYWARRSAIANVRVSPDGQRLGLLKTPARGENPIIEVYDTNDLSKEPFRVNAKPMEITGFEWVDDRSLVMSARQAVRDQIEGFNQGVYEGRIALVDVKKRKIRKIKEDAPTVVSVLPNKPGKILISFSEGGSDGPGAKLDTVFRPRAYWELDLNRGSKKLVIRGKLSLGNIDFDKDGNPVIARGFDLDSGDFVWYFREPGGSGWREAYRLNEENFESSTYRIYGLDSAAPGHLIVGANNGDDKIGLWSFDAANKTFAELLYRRQDVDICGVRYHSNRWTHPNEVVGVRWCKDKIHVEWFDEAEMALHRQLESLIPHANYVTVSSRSRAGDTLAVRNLGPRDPGTYYLIHKGRVQVVGGAKPYLEAEQLADVRYITYPARDGRQISAYLTVPNGEPPFPLVVLPHGGPFVGEIVLYDEWGQLLANNGYLVLQPQYRGSLGYGMEFYRSAFKDGGQGGHKMQDDKDDGVAYLIKEGMTTEGNVAMFGWSYGGYAALVAASRTPQAYQCAIAGAAVSDTEMQVNYYRYRLRGAQKNEQLAMWDDSISPIEEVEKVNVPLLLIHGDVDQRVPVEHAEKYLKRLEKAGKPHQWVLLEGADHFGDTLFYDHKITLYTELLDYLKDECALKPS